MYPANYFNLFPPFPRDDTVFVAMSFEERFRRRYVEVIEPAIQGTSVDGRPLRAMRVDARVVGDSILTEILAGIGRARVVLADLTSIGSLDARAIRSGNVMYEVGLAHAVRLPEEVLLFRSDNDPLLFDTAHVRVNTYSPDEDARGARQKLGDAIVSAVNEIDLRRLLAVQAAADNLDAPSLKALMQCQTDGMIMHPLTRTMGQALGAVSTASAIQRLLSIGLLSVRYKTFTAAEAEALGDADFSEGMQYVTTPFGRAVLLEVRRRMLSNTSPDAVEAPRAAVRAEADGGASASGQGGSGSER